MQQVKKVRIRTPADTFKKCKVKQAAKVVMLEFKMLAKTCDNVHIYFIAIHKITNQLHKYSNTSTLISPPGESRYYGEGGGALN